MKTLLITHNPVSTHQNMGKTILSLFDVFPTQELCQLYIYPSLPDTDKCGAYFQVTDKDVLQSYRSMKVNSREIFPQTNKHDLFSDPEDFALYRNRKNKEEYIVNNETTSFDSGHSPI